MKKLLIILLAVLPVIAFSQEKTTQEKATQTEKKQKIQVKPYGFVKGDMTYASHGVYSWGNINNDYLASPQIAGASDDPALGFTAQHTRFGLKITKEGEYKVGGKIEMDFYGGAADANGKPRIRQAYVSLAKNNFEIRVGQQWDIFSPVNAATNNTNGNMWYAGNRGFRRGQIQLRYKLPANSLIQLAICEPAKEAGGLGADNLSAMPMIQGRLSTKLADKYGIGAYFAYAKFNPLPDVDNTDFSANGFGADFNLNFAKLFALKGEVNYGTNLNNANLFNIAGSALNKDDDRNSLGIWFNSTSKISDHFILVIGAGMDKNNSDNLGSGDIEQNTVIYGNFIFPIENGFSFAAELQNISTKVNTSDDNSALILNFAAKLTF
ncbi:MAG: hypothetical protein IMY72_02265 [Bacteroidetes bacterium]|nr:hypothetical protein [Bacteroidota bacterium]